MVRTKFTEPGQYKGTRAPTPRIREAPHEEESGQYEGTRLPPLRIREAPPGEEKAKGKTPVKADAKAKGKMPVKADEKAKGKMPVKADEKGKGKMPMTADEKAKGKKTVASKKLKIGNSGESETVQKRKVMSHGGDTEAGGSQVKKVKTRNKNETDKGAVGTTRVLRSNSAKKGGEAGREAVKKYSAKGKTQKQSDEAIMPSAAKESTSKRATRVGARRQVTLQKNVKGKNILESNKAEEESDSDEDMHISGIKKKDSLAVKSSKPKKTLPAKKAASLTGESSKPDLPVESSRRTSRRVGKSKKALSQGLDGDSTAVASSSKTVAKQVSKAEKKKGGVQASATTRKYPTRKAQAAVKTNK